MRRLLALLALLGVAVVGGGCGPLDPFEAETLEPLERFEVRITSGIGAADPYFDSVEVAAGNTVQLQALIADGRVIEVRIPREPASEIVAGAYLEDSTEPLATTTLRSRTGNPISVERLYSFDPGYISVEADEEADELLLRVATPRLTDTGQGQVPFTFKTDVVAAPASG